MIRAFTICAALTVALTAALAPAVWVGAQSAADGLEGILDPVTPATIALPTPTAAPVATSQPAVSAAESLLVRILDARVAQLLPMLEPAPAGAEDTNSPTDTTTARPVGPEAIAAQRALLSLHEAFAATLLRQYDDASPEARSRIADTLAQCARRTREELLLAELSPEQREKLLEFRQWQPRLYAEAISEPYDRRAAAISGLMKRNDPRQLAEPLLVMALRSPRSEPQRAALNVIAQKRYPPTDDLIDAMTDLVLASSGISYYYASLRDSYGESRQPPAAMAHQQLRIWKPARITPRLMGTLLDGNMPADGIVDLLAAIGDARCVPTIAALLKNSSSPIHTVYENQRNDNDKNVSRTRGDALLYLLLRLTNQSPAAYGMVSMPYATAYDAYGFEKTADRKEALALARQWFEDNKERYKDVPAMKLSSRTKAPVQPPRWPGQAKAADSELDPASLNDALNVAALNEEIARTVTRMTAGLDAPSPAARTRAQERLIDLHRRLTDPLLANAREPIPKFLLQNMAALCEGLSYAASLDKPMRDKLLHFRERSDDLFRLFFQLDPANQIMALNALPRKDDGSGEGMVILGLSSTADVRARACGAAASGLYRSDRTIDLLCDLLSGRDVVEVAAVNALAKIGSPRVSPLLLERMKGNDLYRAESYREALVASGDLRLVPTLVARLGQNKDTPIRMSSNGQMFSICLDDQYLYILLKLTGQSPTEYKLNVPSDNDIGRNSFYRVQGFTDNKDRDAAYAKMRTWWEAHKNQPPYKDLESLPSPPPPQSPNKGPDFSEIIFD